MAAQTPEELMAEYCYKDSATLDPNSGDRFKIEIAPQETLSFGNWATTKISTPVAFTITNTGYDDVTITRLEVAGDFQFLDDVPTQILAGETYEGRLYFAPTETGTLTGLLAIDAENAIGDHSLSLTGIGWDFLDPDIKGIVNEPGLTLDTFPYWDDQLDVIVNTDLPVSLV